MALFDYVAGEGIGRPNRNRVSVYDGAGQPAGVSFLAYGALKWGVNVASGDVDGDGFGEILTGPGPGDVFGPQVRGFTRSGTPIPVNFYAYGTLRFGVNVAASEMDGDSIDEIISGAGPGDIFGPHVRGWNYDGVRLTPIRKVSFFAYKTLKWGVNVAGGEIDGDGFGELLTGPGPGQVFGTQVRGFNYDGSSVTPIGRVNFVAYQSVSYGAEVGAGDADADGFAEIGVSPGAGPANAARFRGFNYDGASVALLPGFDVTPFATKYGGRLGFGDVDADGNDDLVAAAGPDGTADSTVLTYSYASGTLVQSVVIFLPFGPDRYGCNIAAGGLGW